MAFSLIIAKYYKPGANFDNLEKKCQEVFNVDDEDVVIHYVGTESDDEDDDYDDDGTNLSESESILGSFFGSRPSSEVYPIEIQNFGEDEFQEEIEPIKGLNLQQSKMVIYVTRNLRKNQRKTIWILWVRK